MTMPAPTWREMTDMIRTQKDREPQKGALNDRARASVVEGLTHLAASGYHFEIVPKGTLAALTAEVEAGQRTLSIEEASAQMRDATPRNELDPFTAQA